MGSSGLEMDDLFEDRGDSLPDGWETGQDRSVVLDPAEIAWDVALARKGGPGRKVYRTGSASAVGSLANESDFEKALREYDKEKLAESSRKSQSAHVKWWIGNRFLRRGSPPPFR